MSNIYRVTVRVTSDVDVTVRATDEAQAQRRAAAWVENNAYVLSGLNTYEVDLQLEPEDYETVDLGPA